MQLSLFNDLDDKILTDLFRAYFNARKNKRNTINALAFEHKFEDQIFSLFDDITNLIYQPRPCICFIVDKPVKREIFAADFRDRVIHHFIFNCISPLFEKLFINDCYSCRVGKGTHYGIRRLDHFIRSCSSNYSKDCHVLKLDISGYFMSMDRSLLFEKIKTGLDRYNSKIEFDLPILLYLIERTIFSDPTNHCRIKGKSSDWKNLPNDKSLFHSDPDCGLPIGNLTSQLFGNIYMSDFDHFIKRDLGIKCYGRYVDDFVLVHRDKAFLKSLIPVIREYLKTNLMLDLHPKKVYLQNSNKGVKYLGVVIKPHRIYIANRTKGNFFDAIQMQNKVVKSNKPSQEDQEIFLSSMNSYLGILKHFKTYKLRKKMIFKNLSGWWWNYVHLTGKIGKFVVSHRPYRKRQLNS